MTPASQHRLSRIVQSRQNSRVKELRAGFSSGSLTANGRVSVEGEHLLGEAIRSGLPIATIFFRSGEERLLERIAFDDSVEVLELPPEIFASAVMTDSPQGVAALVEPRPRSAAELFQVASPLLVVAAGLQDPGNLGTLVRSAEGLGAAGMIVLPGTVSVWNAKALRASSGSAFRLPVIAMNEEEMFALLREKSVRTLAAAAERGGAAMETDLTQGVALVIGNEGRGLAAEILARADGQVMIPCPGPVESLNAGVAGSILLYEASRQRKAAGRT